MRRNQFFFTADAGGGTGGGDAAGGNTLLSAGSSQQHQNPDPASASTATGGGGDFAWTKPDGAFSEGWLDKLPEDLRGNDSLKIVGNVTDLAKSYVATKKLVGTKLEMPGEGATPEQLASWRKTVGAPEKPEGYLGEAKTLRPENVPAEYWDAKSEKAFLDLAHKHHLSPAAVKDLVAFQAASTTAALEAGQAKQGEILQAEGTKLRQAWGQEFDANLHLASRVAQTVGLDPKTHPIFTSAEVVQAFAKLGKLFSEDKLVKGDSSGISGSISERIRDFTDPASSSVPAREYRGEFGPERQAAAQQQLHQLYAAQGGK